MDTPTPFKAVTVRLLATDDREDAAQRRAAMWLRLLDRARELGYVAPACKEFGVPRTTFYRIWRLYRRGGPEALLPAARRSISRSPALQREVEAAVLGLTQTCPDFGRHRLASALQAQGYDVSPQRVWKVWKRHGLLRPDRSHAARPAALSSSVDGEMRVDETVNLQP